MRQVIEENSKSKVGVRFHLAFSPEPEDLGNPRIVVARIQKIVPGFIKRLVPVSSRRAGEAATLFENIFRSVNIALVNELKMGL